MLNSSDSNFWCGSCPRCLATLLYALLATRKAFGIKHFVAESALEGSCHPGMLCMYKLVMWQWPIQWRLMQCSRFICFHYLSLPHTLHQMPALGVAWGSWWVRRWRSRSHGEACSTHDQAQKRCCRFVRPNWELSILIRSAVSDVPGRGCISRIKACWPSAAV